VGEKWGSAGEVADKGRSGGRRVGKWILTLFVLFSVKRENFSVGNRGKVGILVDFLKIFLKNFSKPLAIYEIFRYNGSTVGESGAKCSKVEQKTPSLQVRSPTPYNDCYGTFDVMPKNGKE